MAEKQFTKQVADYLKTIDCWWYHPADRYRKGLPDFLICQDGKFIAVELKMKDKDPEPLQAYTGRKIELNGGKYYVCYSMADVRMVI